MKKRALKPDQLSALVLLAFSGLYAYGGSLSEVGFYSGVIGPNHWVYLVGAVLAFLSLWLFFKPTPFQPQSLPAKVWNRRLPLIGSVVLYAGVLPYIGFLGAMIPLMVLTSWLFGARVHFALISALIMTGLCLLLFEGLLGISLGRGLWFS